MPIFSLSWKGPQTSKNSHCNFASAKLIRLSLSASSVSRANSASLLRPCRASSAKTVLHDPLTPSSRSLVHLRKCGENEGSVVSSIEFLSVLIHSKTQNEFPTLFACSHSVLALFTQLPKGRMRQSPRPPVHLATLLFSPFAPFYDPTIMTN